MIVELDHRRAILSVGRLVADLGPVEEHAVGYRRADLARRTNPRPVNARWLAYFTQALSDATHR